MQTLDALPLFAARPRPYLPPVRHFDGSTYLPSNDLKRLTEQGQRVFSLMRDGFWRTLYEIECISGDGQASISARLRDFRKEKFGKHTVNRRHRGNAERGLYEYQLIVNAARAA